MGIGLGALGPGPEHQGQMAGHAGLGARDAENRMSDTGPDTKAGKPRRLRQECRTLIEIQRPIVQQRMHCGTGDERVGAAIHMTAFAEDRQSREVGLAMQMHPGAIDPHFRYAVFNQHPEKTGVGRGGGGHDLANGAQQACIIHGLDSRGMSLEAENGGVHALISPTQGGDYQKDRSNAAILHL
ncbi:hypothetical protein GCM10010975_14620 [Comamonas phosphati]|nr:hypothetical protein GCM10010975_14620 [Comamonas phosphati]